ncbi:MAG: GrpB family protein [Acidimicrobiaceae bacterium]|nr:GrpB family protein [Acidimicrobiaceae bacterium]
MRARACATASLIYSSTSVVGVEQIGSSSVVGLLAKPIVDIAVGLAAEHDLQPVHERLVGAGWIYRGDAGASGGHVYVLETQQWHRVAHLHVVDQEGEQWSNYLRLRNLLRRDPSARARYEAVKQQLAGQVADDRTAYTDGKTSIVHQPRRTGTSRLPTPPLGGPGTLSHPLTTLVERARLHRGVAHR